MKGYDAIELFDHPQLGEHTTVQHMMQKTALLVVHPGKISRNSTNKEVNIRAADVYRKKMDYLT